MFTLTQPHFLPSHPPFPQPLQTALKAAPNWRLASALHPISAFPAVPLGLMGTDGHDGRLSKPDQQTASSESGTAVQPRILVVEDESIVALDLIVILKQLGYGIAGHALSGEEAIQQALLVQPHLVLMDIRLQGAMDGVEAARQIRLRLRIPVIYLTAFVDEPTRERARLTTPAAWLRKPFSQYALEDAIHYALHQPGDQR